MALQHHRSPTTCDRGSRRRCRLPSFALSDAAQSGTEYKKWLWQYIYVIYIYVCIIHTYICIIYLDMHVYMHEVPVYVDIYVCMIYICIYVWLYDIFVLYIYVCMYIHICVYTYIFFLSIAQSQSPLQLLHQIHSDMIPRIAQCHSTELLTSEGMDSELVITSSGRANLLLLLSILLSFLFLFHLRLLLSLLSSSTFKECQFAHPMTFCILLTHSWPNKFRSIEKHANKNI